MIYKMIFYCMPEIGMDDPAGYQQFKSTLANIAQSAAKQN